MTRNRLRSPLLLAFLVFVSLTLVAQPNAPTDKEKEFAAWIKANYTKYEFRIPVRDGVRLFTSVYVPKDDSQTYPIMLSRTPYSVAPYGIENYKTSIGPNEMFARSKYIFVYQDVRGRWMSDGQFEDVRPYIPNKKSPQDVDESSDTYDTIEWLLKNVPGHNGKVGMWGISYPGFYASMGAIDAHPALKAVSPQAPIADWFLGDDFHHNGAMYLPHFFNFFAGFGQARPAPTTKGPPRFENGTNDGYSFFLQLEPLTRIDERFYKGQIKFWNDFKSHPDYDAWWKARNVPQNLKNVKPAMLEVGGWFDAEDLYGALATYNAIEKQSPGGTNSLVMGPWFHGGWSRSNGDHLGWVEFSSKTGDYYRENIEFPFFEYYLKGKGDGKFAEAYVFETGTDQWRTYDTWPPKNTAKKTLYFGPNGRLGFDPPAGDGFDEYVSDPWRPVQYTDLHAINMTREHMATDQRLQGRRPDVLVYQTDPLEGDVTVIGPIQPRLQVSTTGTDSDFVVKLIDVYPPETPDPDPNPASIAMGEYQQLVRGEVMRGRYRNSYEKPEPFKPGEVTKIEYVMPAVNHTFRRGHRIMVQVQSTWFPLVDINPQTFVNIYTAKPEDFKKATQRVYRSSSHASGVNVLVLEQAKPAQ